MWLHLIQRYAGSCLLQSMQHEAIKIAVAWHVAIKDCSVFRSHSQHLPLGMRSHESNRSYRNRLNLLHLHRREKHNYTLTRLPSSSTSVSITINSDDVLCKRKMQSTLHSIRYASLVCTLLLRNERKQSSDSWLLIRAVLIANTLRYKCRYKHSRN